MQRREPEGHAEMHCGILWKACSGLHLRRDEWRLQGLGGVFDVYTVATHYEWPQSCSSTREESSSNRADQRKPKAKKTCLQLHSCLRLGFAATVVHSSHVPRPQSNGGGFLQKHHSEVSRVKREGGRVLARAELPEVSAWRTRGTTDQ